MAMMPCAPTRQHAQVYRPLSRAASSERSRCSNLTERPPCTSFRMGPLCPPHSHPQPPISFLLLLLLPIHASSSPLAKGCRWSVAATAACTPALPAARRAPAAAIIFARRRPAHVPSARDEVFYRIICHASSHVMRYRSMSGMAVAQQLHWIVRNLISEGARYRHDRQVLQQQRHGSTKRVSPQDVGFIIAVPTRNAGM